MTNFSRYSKKFKQVSLLTIFFSYTWILKWNRTTYLRDLSSFQSDQHLVNTIGYIILYWSIKFNFISFSLQYFDVSEDYKSILSRNNYSPFLLFFPFFFSFSCWLVINFIFPPLNIHHPHYKKKRRRRRRRRKKIVTCMWSNRLYVPRYNLLLSLCS